jgi:hypothetical protein
MSSQQSPVEYFGFLELQRLKIMKQRGLCPCCFAAENNCQCETPQEKKRKRNINILLQERNPKNGY